MTVNKLIEGRVNVRDLVLPQPEPKSRVTFEMDPRSIFSENVVKGFASVFQDYILENSKPELLEDDDFRDNFVQCLIALSQLKVLFPSIPIKDTMYERVEQGLQISKFWTDYLAIAASASLLFPEAIVQSDHWDAIKKEALGRVKNRRSGADFDLPYDSTWWQFLANINITNPEEYDSLGLDDDELLDWARDDFYSYQQGVIDELVPEILLVSEKLRKELPIPVHVAKEMEADSVWLDQSISGGRIDFELIKEDIFSLFYLTYVKAEEVLRTPEGMKLVMKHEKQRPPVLNIIPQLPEPRKF